MTDLDQLAEQLEQGLRMRESGAHVPQVFYLLGELREGIKAQREQLETWQAWCQFVWLGGGPAEGSDQQLRARACAAHDLRIREVDVRELMLSAADEWDRPRQIGEGMTTLDQVVDRLLAEYKAQQPCATPTKSSPPAATDAPL